MFAAFFTPWAGVRLHSIAAHVLAHYGGDIARLCVVDARRENLALSEGVGHGIAPGEAWIIQPGGQASAYRFRGVPGVGVGVNPVNGPCVLVPGKAEPPGVVVERLRGRGVGAGLVGESCLAQAWRPARRPE